MNSSHTDRLSAAMRMRGSRNFRHWGGGGGGEREGGGPRQSDKKKKTLTALFVCLFLFFCFFLSPRLILQKSNG